MREEPVSPDLAAYPSELRPLLAAATLYDYSSSPEARVLFIAKDCGYFLKSAPKGALEREAVMTNYYHDLGLAARVVAYTSQEQDWLLTERIPGDDCTAARHLQQPERLCDLLAEQLAQLHATDFTGCPVNHTEGYLRGAAQNYRHRTFDMGFSGNWGFANPEEAWGVVENRGHLLQTDTLLHGDYCLPNIILNNWRLSGYVDLGCAGVGDAHVDLFWATWSLAFNLKTDKYRQRFFDAYGRGNVDEDRLRLVAAIEVFG